MAELTRRRLGMGGIAAVAATQLPLKASALFEFSPAELPTSLREAVTALINNHRTLRMAERNYDNWNHDLSGPYAWRESYDELLQAHECVRDAIEDDTPLTRAVLEWSNRMVPCPARQAIAFWMPVSGLSKEFKPLMNRMFEARRRIAHAHWTFWMEYPGTEIREGETLAHFHERLEALHEVGRVWGDVWRKATETRVRTSGDRELARRLVQSHIVGDTLDVPYLQSAVADWRPYNGWPILYRCPLPCPDCDGLRLPLQHA